MKRFKVFTILICFLSIFLFSNKDRIVFKNGEIVFGEIKNKTLIMSSDYGTFNIPTKNIFTFRNLNNIQKIETIYNEPITAHLMNNSINIDIGGQILNVRKEVIDKIIFKDKEEGKVFYKDYFSMKNRDKFYGKVKNNLFKLTTNYGKIDIPFSNILKIEEKSGQTKVYLKNGNAMQGFIATNFLEVITNHDFTIKIPKNSIKIVKIHKEF